MTRFSRTSALAFFFSLASLSCSEDPVMVEKREKQRIEITRLKGEIALIEEKLKSLPPDVSSELEAAKKVFIKQTAEVEKFEAEVAELELRKRGIQKEFEAYKLKYKVK